jgi:hypothetical protein
MIREIERVAKKRSKQASSISFRQIRTIEIKLYFLLRKKMKKSWLKKSMGPLKDKQKCQESRQSKVDPVSS